MTDKTEPDCKCCLLSEFTEVIIAPKTRSSPSPRQQNHQRQSSSPSHSAHPMKRSPDRNTTVHDLHPSSRSKSRAKEDTESGRIKPEDIKENDVVDKFMNYVRAWWSYLRSSPLAEYSSETLSHNEFCDSKMSWSLRVQKIPDIEDIIESSEQIRFNEHNIEKITAKPRYILQVSNVYVKSDSLLPSNSNARNVICQTPPSFLAVIKRVDSPKDRIAQIKRNMEKAKAEQKAEQIKSRTSQASSIPDSGAELSHSSSNMSLTGVVVRVVVLSDLNQSSDNPYSLFTADSPGGAAVINGHVGISSELRRQAGLELTGRVILKTLHHQHTSLSAITFHPLFKMVGPMWLLCSGH